MSLSPDLVSLLRRLADKYETEAFLSGDPSAFLHKVKGPLNQEAAAFIASCLSFGNRAQFCAKITHLLDLAKGDMHRFIQTRTYQKHFPRQSSNSPCFYRFLTYAHMRALFDAYAELMDEYGTLGEYVKAVCPSRDAVDAVKAITSYFAMRNVGAAVPKDAKSACKRVAMFLRWMVRTDSPVDVGLWTDFIDKATLPIPLDTHVLQEARRLGLLKSNAASMAAATKLSRTLDAVFPGDPCRADFALFGLGVDDSRS